MARPPEQTAPGMPLSLKGWRVVSRGLNPALRHWLKRRITEGKEDPDRVGERFGMTDIARPDGRLVWLHGASVGESQMLLHLARALKRWVPDIHILMTTQTRTAASMLEDQAGEDVIHQYLPFDTPRGAQTFLSHWRPQLGVFGEGEIWPNLLVEADRMDIPLVLVNARMTAKTRARWARMPGLARYLLHRFSWITAADAATAEALHSISGRPVAMFGNLKRAAEPLPVDAGELADWREAMGDRRIWLAASTHQGEDDILARAHRLWNEPAGLLILVPRHPERGNTVAALLRQTGFHVAQRSQDEAIDSNTHIYLADTLGELGLWYRLCETAFIGGSLIDGIGGHNPLEPVQLDVPIMSGPHVANFADIYRDLWAEAGAAQVSGAEDIAACLADDAASARALQVRRAARVAARGPSVLTETLEGLVPFLKGA